MDAARGAAAAAKAGKVETGWLRVWWWRVSHRKEPHTNTDGIKLLKYALQIFSRVKIT